MPYDIGARVGIDGESQFRAQISRINKDYKSMESYLQALDKAMDRNGKSMEALQARHNGLQQQLAMQEKKHKELTEALEKVRGKYDAGSQEVLRFEGALLDVDQTMADLKRQIAATEGDMDRLAKGVDSVADAVAHADSQIAQINGDYKAMSDYLKAVDRSIDLNGKSFDLLSEKTRTLRQQLDSQIQQQQILASALEKVRREYKDGSAEVLRFETALLDVDNAVSALSRELADTEYDMYKLANGIEDVADASDDANGKVLSFGEMLKAGLASGAILHAVEEITELVVELGKASITAAADVKASNSQFSSTFRELESAARLTLSGISEDIKMSSSRLQGAYTSLYAFTKNVGGDSAQALNIAERAIRAAADSAAYYDRTVEDATETLQSFLKGNYENDAALGIAATETTRNAKANELYAKSFKELSEAQKVDVLLAMVEAGNAASGALGAAAREADEWTNVTGELAEAWRQLLALMGGPALEGLIQGITDALKGLTEQSAAQTLTAGMDAFRASIADADAQLQQSNASMAATAGLAQQYVDRLHALDAAGLNTAESQREYRQVVELLNATMPQLNLTIDENTGRLTQNTEAIQTNIANLKKQAQEQAKQAYYKKIIDQYTKAYEEQYAAEMRLIELQEREQQLLEQGADATIEYTTALMGTTSAMPQMTRALSELDQELLRNQAEQRELSTTIEESGATLSEYEHQLDAASKGYAALTDATTEQAQAQDELSGAYTDTQKAARESIDKQIGLFDELATESDMSRKQVLDNWKVQQEAYQNYAVNLQKAVEMGLDQSLIRQLSDGSEQSMLILAELVGGTEGNVAEINAAFSKLSEAKDNAAQAMGEVEQVVSSSLDRMTDDAEDSGRDIVDGAAAGIIRNIPRYVSALEQLANRGQSAYNEVWDRHSPSRWMRDASDDIVDGGADQLRRRSGDMAEAMAALGKAGQDAYAELAAASGDSGADVVANAAAGILRSIPQYRAALAQLSEVSIPAMQEARISVELAGADAALARLDASPQIVQQRQLAAELVKGTEGNVAEINAAFSKLNEAKDNAAQAMGEVEQVVSSSLDRMTDDAEDSGRDIVDGAAAGIIRNIPRYVSALEQLANRGQSAYNEVWDRHSPSRWMRDASDDIVDGGADQLRRRSGDMAEAMAALGKAGQDAYAELAAASGDSGADVVANAAAGILRSIPQYRAALAQLSEVSLPAMQEARISVELAGADAALAKIQEMMAAMALLDVSPQIVQQRQLAADAAAYPSLTAGTVGYTTNTVHNTKNVSLGGVTVVVNARDGQDATALAYEVAAVLEQMFDEGVSAIG